MKTRYHIPNSIVMAVNVLPLCTTEWNNFDGSGLEYLKEGALYRIIQNHPFSPCCQIAPIIHSYYFPTAFWYHVDRFVAKLMLPIDTP